MCVSIYLSIYIYIYTEREIHKCIHMSIYIYVYTHTYTCIHTHTIYIYICIIKSSTDSNNAFDDLAGVVGPAAAEGDLLSAMIGNCNDTRRHDIYIYI